MAKKYIVRLTPGERDDLKKLVRKGRVAGYKRIHAQILLQSDEGADGPGWIDEKISAGLGVRTRTVENVRQRLVEKGLEGALNRAKSSGGKPKRLDGEQEAYLIAMTCGEAPEGRSRWNLRLLANKMVELGHVESLSHETVRQTLKKTKLSPGKKKNGVSLQPLMLSLFVLWKIL